MPASLFGPRTPIAERSLLIRRWTRWFAERTNDWHGPIGTELAYLFGAIANDMFLWLDKTSLVVALLKKEQVPRSNPIWRHIRLKWEHDN